MSEETREALQEVLEFCDYRENKLEDLAEKTDDLDRQGTLTSNATCYWCVKQMIYELLEG